MTIPARASGGLIVLLAYRLASGPGPVSAGSPAVVPAPVSAAEPSRLARAWVVLAGAVVAALPVLLGAWSGATLSAVGQFAMWWSIPWGLGIAGAGALHTGQPGHRDRRPAGSAGKPVVTAEPSPGAALVTVTPGH